jgi:ankyrin repeat protein
MCKLLVDSGINVNLQKFKGTERYTALHIACMSKCDQGVVKLLLESGSDPTITDMYGKTPLDYALENSKAAQPWAKSFQEKVELIQNHLKYRKGP